MPITPSLHIRDITDAEFTSIDEVVMRCAYACQNKFGRLFDERIYENDLAERLRAEGFTVHTQVPVTVTHGGFEKVYYLDLVVNDLIYELKVAAAFLPEHKAQALHYAMLQDVRRVKLLNFGGPKVRGDLQWNTLTTAERHRPRQRKTGWQPITPQCERLVGHIKDLIKDWGTHLSTDLYNEALIHFFGGEPHCLARHEVRAGDRVLGTHLIQHHAPDAGFIVTTLQREQAAFQLQLKNLLEHVSLQGLQWINLNRSRLEITTLQSNDRRMRAGE
ncbi:MAG: GxxExxY protein [Verrucomicrobiaceae bacterium]|nr:GxxExxY protein [Verrucomicrobiaceae bacterium]